MTNLGSPMILKNTGKVSMLKSSIVKELKKLARAKCYRGIKHSQISLYGISRICISCKEIGNPVIEWTRVEPHVMEKITRSQTQLDEKYDDHELQMFYNPPS